MPVEIERKILLADESWRRQARSRQKLRQGYLSSSELSSTRVRIADDCQAWITIKSSYYGIARSEFEYPVPYADVRNLIQLREGQIVEKICHYIEFAGLIWEVDEFLGSNRGLIIAEVELAYECQEIALPSWAGREVTGVKRYQNSQLARYPFSAWRDPHSKALLKVS